MRPDFTNNNKERVPFEHYLAVYEKSDPKEMSGRSAVPYDDEKKIFTFEIMKSRYEITWPVFDITWSSGPMDIVADWAPAQILILRYLTGGQFVSHYDGFKAYQELPDGPVYLQQFHGRCVMRLAYTFDNKEDKLASAMQSIGAVAYEKGDAGYEFEFMPGLKVRISLWFSDDEFGPNAQILFSDNVRYAFSAEDLAFVGDIFIKVLKAG